MTYEAFKEAYNNSEISVLIDKEKAVDFMSANEGLVQQMKAKRRYGYLFSKFIVYSSLGISLVTFIMWIIGEGVNIIIPISMFIVGIMLSQATRKSVCSFMLSEALHNKQFYELVQKKDKESQKPLFTIEQIDE